MMNENVSRDQLERKLLQAMHEVKKDRETGCIDGVSVEEYILRWRELVKYYENNQDFVIGVQVIHSYLEMSQLFFGSWQNSKTPEDCQEIAQDALRSLEAQLQYIIVTVENQLGGI